MDYYPLISKPVQYYTMTTKKGVCSLNLMGENPKNKNYAHITLLHPIIKYILLFIC